MPRSEPAKTAHEFKDKYTRKKYTSQNIGIAFVAQYLYMLYLMNEGVSYEEQYEKRIHLFGKETMGKHAKILSSLDETEYYQYKRYDAVLSWVRTNFQYTVFVRDSTIRELGSLSYLIYETLKIENLIKDTGESNINQEVMKGLNEFLSIEAYKIDSQRRKAVLINKASIERNLRYVHMYNTFIEMLAKAIKIPELNVLSVDVSNMNESVVDANAFIEETKTIAEEKNIKSEGTQFFEDFTVQSAPQIPKDICDRVYSELKEVITKDSGRCETGFENLRNCYYKGLGLDAYAVG